jgi:glyceraldehyde-3-phosphate dehydrogenase/erythrose-4-phosphate dehydrogenase
MKDKLINCGTSGLCRVINVLEYCIVIGSKLVCKVSAQMNDRKWSKNQSQDLHQTDIQTLKGGFVP